MVGNQDYDILGYGTITSFSHNMFSTTYGFNPDNFGGNNQSPPGDLDILFRSIAAGAEDLHLEDGGHNALDTGLDLSSSFTTDIDGNTRTAPWDMGADEATGVPLAMSSAADQTFTVGDSATAISAITITDHSENPTITAAADLRIRIPAGTNMEWDALDPVATISGTASGKVDSAVTFDDAKTLVLDVTSNFAAGESVTISDLNFDNFTAASSADSLTLDVDNDGSAEATDDKTVTIDPSGGGGGSTSGLLTVVSWQEVAPQTTPGAPSSSIRFDNVTTDPSSSARGSASFTHTMGASCACCTDSIIIVITMTRGDQGTASVEYGGLALDEAISERTLNDSNAEWVQIFYRVDPPTGDNTVDVTFNNSADPTMVAAISYFGVDQTSPIGAVASDSSTSSASTVSTTITTTVANSVVVGGLGHHGGDTDPHTEGGDVTTELLDEATGRRHTPTAATPAARSPRRQWGSTRSSGPAPRPTTTPSPASSSSPRRRAHLTDVAGWHAQGGLRRSPIRVCGAPATV